MTDFPISSGLLVVGARAGDAECMAGALVLKHTRAGLPAKLVHMALGEPSAPGEDPNLFAARRAEETREAARRLGAETTWLEYEEGQLRPAEGARLEICDLIRLHRPSAVLTHWKGSANRDHTAVYHVVLDAVTYAALPSLKRLTPDGAGLLPAHTVQSVYFPENWEDMEGWRADLYVDVSDVWDDYLEALRAHSVLNEENENRFRYLDYYGALGITRGCLARKPRAVALMLPPGGWVRKVDYLPGLEPGSTR